MSYRLINSNALAIKYPEVNDMPCVFANLPNGMHGQLIDEPIWHPYPKEKPKEADEYLVVQNSSLGVYYDIVFWGKSKWVEDAQKEYKKRAAYWYQYDPEWGDYTCDNVIAWMPIPKYEKEKTDETN